ncbi:hypothetical protein N7492_009874 [Penicillium capsulatum]|uniref:HNH nuclease domain-containing protein n=1 Tax=Penicillium capsulatum TaxID=69766 RepID=A0A9W9HME1_9EURO|nr:hypothetical protein N7492_009874 [Penicillium capsulatum]KAJ6112385.1 hypothetical protein N7512_007709 [Penicillium capsulatum]
MRRSRSAGRNVNFFDGVTSAHLGGVRQNGSITNANFFHMLMDVLLVVDGMISIRLRGTGQPMPISDRLAEGDYNIFCPRGNIQLTKEISVQRIISHTQSTGENCFRNLVRARDGKSAHVFPLHHQALWDQCDFNHVMNHSAPRPINSVQNGILVAAHMHQLFDGFLVSVNPDDGYKITDFGHNNWDVDGQVLDIVYRDPNNPNRVPDELFRWHFRQSVLANMKGAGEPIFEHDFPPGTDMVKEILEGPLPARRMELELFARLEED